MRSEDLGAFLLGLLKSELVAQFGRVQLELSGSDEAPGIEAL